MVDQGITTPVGDGESDWVNLHVMRARPDGRLHISLDPSDLNKVIKRENTTQCQQYMTLLPDFTGATQFSKLNTA